MKYTPKDRKSLLLKFVGCSSFLLRIELKKKLCLWWLYYFDICTLIIIDENYSYKLHISWGILPEVRKDTGRLMK